MIQLCKIMYINNCIIYKRYSLIFHRHHLMAIANLLHCKYNSRFKTLQISTHICYMSSRALHGNGDSDNTADGDDKMLLLSIARRNGDGDGNRLQRDGWGWAVGSMGTDLNFTGTDGDGDKCSSPCRPLMSSTSNCLRFTVFYISEQLKLPPCYR